MTTHIAILTPSPLLAGGLAAALQGVDGWTVGLQGDAGSADALVLHARDAAEALALHAGLPPGVPAVLLAEPQRELARRAAADRRPLALLAPNASAARLRAALAAVLQGLSVREAADDADGFDAARGPGHLPGPLPDHEPLTPRELEVFELIGKGLSNRDIAGVLGISAHTAKFHVGQILAKVGAATRAEAVGTGLRLGLIGL